MSHRRRVAPAPKFKAEFGAFGDPTPTRGELRARPELGPATPKLGLTVRNTDRDRLAGDLRRIEKAKRAGKDYKVGVP